MNLSFDTIIVGCGLAGACTAFELSDHERVLLVDRHHPGAGASGIPVGLVSPLMARRARPVWRMEEAVAAFHRMLRQSGTEALFGGEGILKPAGNAEQAAAFRDAADRWPEHGVWHDASPSRNRWPYLSAPHGLLEVTSGGSVAMPALCNALVEAAVARGARFRSGARLMGWTEHPDYVGVHLSSPSEQTVVAERLLIAVGAGFLDFPELAALHLHPIKGQWIRLIPEAEKESVRIAPVSSRRYVASDRDGYVVGSTYEHTYTDLEPTAEAASELKSEAVALVPELLSARIVDASASVRVTVPEIRLPMVGPLPGRKRIWIFTGLGSKGLLMAPLLARELPEFFTERMEIPKSIRVN